MIGKGKVLSHFCKETLGKQQAYLILDSRMTFAYTPGKSELKCLKMMVRIGSLTLPAIFINGRRRQFARV
jgi:hypothetical protein